MARNQKSTEQLDEMKRKLAMAELALEELRSVIAEMEKHGITTIDTTSVDQANRATQYLTNYATASRKAFISKLHARP